MQTRPWKIPVLLAVAALAAMGHTDRASDAAPDTFDIYAYVAVAAQGQLGPFRAWIDGDRVVEGTAGERLDRLRARLGPTPAPRAETTGSAHLDDALATYREYWRRAMRGELGEGDTRDVVAADVAALLRERGIDPGDDALATLRDALRAEGFHVQGDRTRPHEDLFVWRRDDAREYAVDLGDTTVTVAVHFMSDFVSYGWMGWATDDVSHAGGWAKQDALYCTIDRYDVDSEDFRVGYLKHEGRHFVDYVQFPALDQVDLEYRAKLTEILHRTHTLAHAMEGFVRQAAPNPASPHAMAAYALLRDLEDALGAEPAWADGAAVQSLKSAADRVLRAHGDLLRARGAATISGVLEERFAADVDAARS